MIIQDVPNLSRSIANWTAKNVSCIGMKISPPSDTTIMRFWSASRIRLTAHKIHRSLSFRPFGARSRIMSVPVNPSEGITGIRGKDLACVVSRERAKARQFRAPRSRRHRRFGEVVRDFALRQFVFGEGNVVVVVEVSPEG